MRTLTTFLLISLVSVASSLAQGTINFGNSLGATVFRAPIFGPEVDDPTREIHGQPPSTSLGFPAGNTIYTGPRLSGGGYTLALFISATADGPMNMVVSSPFLTGTAAGFIAARPALAMPTGFAVGTRPYFEIRAWENQSGALTTWEQVLANPSVPRGSSGVLQSPVALGGIDSTGNPVLVGNLTGWTSFNIHAVPEPSIMLLGLGCVGTALFFRKRRSPGL